MRRRYPFRDTQGSANRLGDFSMICIPWILYLHGASIVVAQEGILSGRDRKMVL
jgi:hypothetical protein